MRHGRRPPARLHPCVPVPAHERRRLELALLLGLGELEGGSAPVAWCDVIGATEIALRLLDPGRHDPAAIAAAWLAHRALHAHAEGAATRDEALQAARAFAPTFAALLAAVGWQRLADAQDQVRARWERDGAVHPVEQVAGSP